METKFNQCPATLIPHIVEIADDLRAGRCNARDAVSALRELVPIDYSVANSGTQIGVARPDGLEIACFAYTTPLPPCVQQLRSAIALLPDAPAPDLIPGMISYTKAALALEAALEIVDRESRNMDTAKAAIAESVDKSWNKSEIPASLRNALTR